MNRNKVTSSNIESIGYDAATRTLEIEFKNKEIYQYENMPAAVYRELMSAASHGEYFSEHIKNGGFAYKKVSSNQDMYFIDDGGVRGPYTKSQIISMWSNGTITAHGKFRLEANDEWEPVASIAEPRAQSTAIKTPPAISTVEFKKAPSYLHIPWWRFALLSILSLGVFCNYFVYKNWKYIKERDNVDIMPFWRGWFCIFHVYSLFKEIRKDYIKAGHKEPITSAGGMATVFIICHLLFKGLLTFPFLIPAQNQIGKINKECEYSPWSFGQIFCITGAPIIIVMIAAASAR